MSRENIRGAQVSDQGSTCACKGCLGITRGAAQLGTRGTHWSGILKERIMILLLLSFETEPHVAQADSELLRTTLNF